MFSHFYHRLMRKYVAIFGTLFNNLYVTRYASSGAIDTTIKVPLAYGPKEKFITRIKSDPTLTKSILISVPRLSFEITGITYDPERKQQTTLKLQGPPTSNTSVKSTYAAAPYNIDFVLNLYVRNIEDGTQIAEQILPYFQPDFTVTATLVPEMQIKKDIPVLLNSVNQTIDYEGGLDSTRLIIWTFDFTMKGYFFGPSANTDVIKGTSLNTGGMITGNTGGILVNFFQDNALPETLHIQTVTLANTGFGIYIEGETVRNSNNDIFGIVETVSNTSSGLSITLTDTNKPIDVGQLLIGDMSRAKYLVVDTRFANSTIAKIGIQQTPISANVINDFGYTTTTLEFPDTI